MTLRRTILALRRIGAMACCEASLAGPSPTAVQQPFSVWNRLARQGFAASATVQQVVPAVASAGTSLGAAPTAATTAAGGGLLAGPTPPPASAMPPEVYVRLNERVGGEQYSVQPKRVFAVVEVGGTQYKVTPNDVIVVEKLADVDVNDKLQLQRVLLLGSQVETIIGRPYVPEAAVTAAVEEQFLDGKVLIFHKRRRKNSRRLRGHRQPLTTLRILDVDGIAEADAAGMAPTAS